MKPPTFFEIAILAVSLSIAVAVFRILSLQQAAVDMMARKHAMDEARQKAYVAEIQAFNEKMERERKELAEDPAQIEIRPVPLFNQ